MPTTGRPPAARLALPSIVWPLAIGAIFAQAACKEDDPEEEAAPLDAGAEQADATASADASIPPDSGADAAPEPGNADPMDLDAVDGDPSLDISSSEIFFESGAPWVRVRFYGAWPPPAQLDSWQCAVLLGTENAPVVTYTVQGDLGVQTDFADGIDKAKMTFAVEPRGFRVRFGETTLAFDRYGLECSVKKTPQGTTAQDTSGTFVVGAKIERPFGS